MISQKIDYRAIEKHKYSIYLDKSKNFFEIMNHAYDMENWDGVGLNAVHCVISANDAILTSQAGLYCADKNHLKAVALFRQKVNLPGVKEAANHLQKTVAMKNTIAYEARPFTRKMAKTIRLHATRFYNWVTGHFSADQDKQ